jgi:hypothetical protein
MKTYVLGAGASLHAGYPLMSGMLAKLLEWMRTRENASFRDSAEWVTGNFEAVTNIEDLFGLFQTVIQDFAGGTLEERALRSNVANFQRPSLVQALCEWFAEISGSTATAYRWFASNIVAPGDCIITFNYDVSLDHELRAAGKWEVGDGYGFEMDGLPADSLTTLLKLHGSTNWLAILFGGITSGLFQFQGSSLGARPVIGPADLGFLNYTGLHDPLFTRSSAAVSPMILPTRSKQFFFDTSFGREWETFWHALWERANQSLSRSEEVFVLGYSLAPADERACELLFTSPRRDARIEISSGGDTESIVKRFRDHGYPDAVNAEYTRFEDWVGSKTTEES